jgi:FkbM family methyltransferase
MARGQLVAAFSLVALLAASLTVLAHTRQNSEALEIGQQSLRSEVERLRSELQRVTVDRDHALQRSQPRQLDPRLATQCLIWSTWLGAPAAAPGMPCHLVSTPTPQHTFTLPAENGTDVSLQEFQPVLTVAKEAAARHQAGQQPPALLGTLTRLLDTDNFMPGSGRLPTMAQYLELLAAVQAEVHVVQIGANAAGDGELNEWVRPVLKEHPSWSATVVEPVPFLFELLRRNYKPIEGRVEAMRYAVAGRTGKCTMYAADSRGNRKQVSTVALSEAHGTRCFTPDRPCRFVRAMVDSGALKPLEVECVTLDELLRRRRNPSVAVDVLVIDAEMLDYTLLRSINLRAIAPLAIEFESKTMTVQQGMELAALLAVQGYLCRFAPAGAEQWPGRAWWKHYGGAERSAESVCFRSV